MPIIHLPYPPIDLMECVSTPVDPPIDHKVLLELSDRHPTRGFCAPLKNEEDLKTITDAFISMGVPINEKIKNTIKETILSKEVIPSDRSDFLYLATDNEDRFLLCSAEHINQIRRANLLTFKTEEDIRYQYREDKVIHCETEEMAKLILLKAKEYGYKKANGEEWIGTGGFFNYSFGDKTCYDIFNGTEICSDSTSRRMILSQKVLYDVNVELLRVVLPVGHLIHSQLESGKIYKRFFGNFRGAVYFKYTGAESDIGTVDSAGNYYLEGISLTPNDYRETFMPATTEEKRDFRRAVTRYMVESARQRVINRDSFLEERKQRLFREKNNMDNYNKDVETQLFSRSFHKILTKALDNKVVRCLLKLNKMGYLAASTRNVTIRSSDKVMTYSPSGKNTGMTESGNWNSKGRQEGKYGKVIRKILKEQVPRLKFTDHEIEQLVNHLKAEAGDGDFQTVKGEKILDWYDGERYSEDDAIGTLGCSCMRDSECREFMRIYSDNPNQVKMLILTKKSKLIGRAIIWNDKWMDRIYGTDSIIKAFKNYAKEEGYHCKATQGSCPDDGWINPATGKRYEKSIVIDLDNTEFEHYPYADTMCYIDVDGNQVSNSYGSLSSYVEMRDTGGYLEAQDMVYDEYAGEDIHEGDAVYLEYRGYDTHHENTGTCAIDGHTYLHDDMVETWDGDMVYDENVQYVSQEEAYARDNQIYNCGHDGNDYIEGLHESVHIAELDTLVMLENVVDAYMDNDYHFVDEEWESREDLESRGYTDTDGEWVLDETINIL